MKRFIQKSTILMVVMALATLAWGDSGNKLMQNQTHWYQVAAETAGPVDQVTAGKGTLLTLQPGSSLYMVGDSTLHQYQMNAHALKGSAVVKGSDWVAALKAGKTGTMTLIVPVADFKSRESGLDDNAHKALKAADNPNIRFDLAGAQLADDGTLTATGTLSIAGASAPVTLSAAATVTGSQIRLKGTQKLKMTDFKITPPSISLVVTNITCTDEIEIDYDVIFAAK